MKWKKYLLVFTFLIFCVCFSLSAQNLKIYFLDVHQGNGVVVITPNKKVLVDDCNSGYDNKVISTLSSEGITTITQIIATHPDNDHMGGLDDVINNFTGTIYNCYDNGHSYTNDSDYTAWTNAIASKGLNHLALKTNDEIVLDSAAGVTYRCLASDGYVIGKTNKLSSDPNGESVVILLTYKNFDIWLGGDATGPIEYNLVSKINDASFTKDGDVTVYQVDHHGSNAEESGYPHSCQDLLNAMNPQISIIQSKSGYGHPTQEVVDRLVGVNSFNDVWLNESTNDGETNDADPTKYPSRCHYVGGDILLETDGYNVWVNENLIVGSGIVFTPDKLLNNGINQATIEAKVAIAPSEISYVYADLSHIGGVTTQTLYDDGSHGDTIASNGIYTFNNIRTTTNDGNYPISVVVFRTDNSSATNIANLTVVDDTYAPLANSFSAKLTNNIVKLKWDNPTNSDFDHLIIRYKYDAFSTSTNDGILLYSSTNNIETYLFSNPEYYKRYYFTIFFVDTKGNYSKLSQDLLVIPTDESEYAKISDNYIKPDDIEKKIRIIFNDSVINPSLMPTVKIYNVQGEIVKKIDVTLNNLDTSNNSVEWDLDNNANIQVGSGLYFIVINTLKGDLKEKVLIVR